MGLIKKTAQKLRIANEPEGPFRLKPATHGFEVPRQIDLFFIPATHPAFQSNSYD